MSFGFPVSDFITVGQIIADITSCLDGTSSEHQELIRELDTLQKALHHIDTLRPSGCSTDLDSIKYAAIRCRQPLEEFLGSVKKYKRSLGLWNKSNTVVRVAGKLRFGLGKKDEIRKLPNYLIHVGTINVL